MGSWKFAVEKRAKLFEINKLKKRIAELQMELAAVVSDINKVESQIEDAKKKDDRAWSQLGKIKAEQEKMLNGFATSIRNLEEKIMDLRKEKAEAENSNRRVREEIGEYEEMIKAKEQKVKKLKMILPVKQQDLLVLQAEQKQIEKSFQEKMNNALMEQTAKRERDYQHSKEAYAAKIKSYVEEAKGVEILLEDLNRERLLLQNVVTLYTTRLPMLAEKQMLLASEFQCMVNAELNDDFLNAQMEPPKEET